MFALRSRIARDLHDDIGSSLSSISMMSSLGEMKQGTGNSNDLFSSIGTVSKQAMDMMDDIIWAINPLNDKLDNILTRMRKYAAETLEAKNIPFSFIVEEGIEDIHLTLEKRRDFFLIFKEAVNNLAKYSGCSHAAIEIKKEKNLLLMAIKDNGKGFNTKVNSQRNGVRNMHERASSMKAILSIESNENSGTVISLRTKV
jgi:signal transduction histidine kinase